MRTKFKYSIFISIMFLFSLLLLPGYQAEAASAKIKLNKTSVTLYTKGEKTVKLKAVVTGSSKKVKWSSSNKKVATVSASGKVTAKKAGKAVITAKVGKSTAKCQVTVKDSPKDSSKDVKKLLAKYAGTYTPNAFAASSFYWPKNASVTLHADGSVSGYIGSKGYQKQNTVRPVKINVTDAGAIELVIADQARTTEKFMIYPAGVRPADYSSSYYNGHLNLKVPNLSYFFASANGGALKLLYDRK